MPLRNILRKKFRSFPWLYLLVGIVTCNRGRHPTCSAWQCKGSGSINPWTLLSSPSTFLWNLLLAKLPLPVVKGAHWCSLKNQPPKVNSRVVTIKSGSREANRKYPGYVLKQMSYYPMVMKLSMGCGEIWLNGVERCDWERKLAVVWACGRKPPWKLVSWLPCQALVVQGGEKSSSFKEGEDEFLRAGVRAGERFTMSKAQFQAGMLMVSIHCTVEIPWTSIAPCPAGRSLKKAAQAIGSCSPLY